jgi:hypothetical protein
MSIRDTLSVLSVLACGGLSAAANAQAYKQSDIQHPSSGGEVKFGPPPSAEWKAMLDHLYASDYASAKQIGDSGFGVSMALVDLDGDGKPELMAHHSGISACGSRGCSLYVYRQQGNAWVTVLTVLATKLEVSRPVAPGKWRNITLDFDKPFRFATRQYERIF